MFKNSSITKLFVVFGLSFASFSNAAYAQDGDRSVVYKKKTEIDFEGLDVSGELVKPSGALLLDRKRASFNPLIRLRTDFNEEMAASVEEIK